MENLIFSLNATIPVFLLMVLGFVFRKLGWLDQAFAEKMNKFVFLVPLPVLLFQDLATVDFRAMWDGKFVFFCFGVTFLGIALSALLSMTLKDRSLRGEFIQASYRSSAALLGIAFIQNIYGSAGIAPLMIIGSVPLYNVMAVLVLSLFQPGQRGLDRAALKKQAQSLGLGCSEGPVDSSGNALVYIGPTSAGDQRIVLTKAAELGLGYGIYTPPAQTPEKPDEPAGDDIEALRAELEASKAEAQALRNSLASMTAERDTALQQAREAGEKAEAATERAEHAEAKIKAAQAALEG